MGCCEKYVMRFNPDIEKFSKVELPKDDGRDASLKDVASCFMIMGSRWFVMLRMNNML